MSWSPKWGTATVAFAVIAAAASASPAAAVTIGQLAPNTTTLCSMQSIDILQPSATSANAYTVPGTGTITSWSHNANANAATLTMKVFRKTADPAFYQAVGRDGPRPLAASLVNTFPVSIPVKPGDVLGLNLASPAETACSFTAPGDSNLFRVGNLADGDVAAFVNVGHDSRLNLSAVFAPTNSFTLGGVKRNKKKGTAKLTVQVPNPGTLTASGKGVKLASAGGAVVSTTVTAPGEVRLPIKATGKKKKKLKQKGKVQVKPTITYTPTGGDPSSQSIKLKLKKKL